MLAPSIASHYAANLLARHRISPAGEQLADVFGLPGNNLEVLTRWVSNEAFAEKLEPGPLLRAFLSVHFRYVICEFNADAAGQTLEWSCPWPEPRDSESSPTPHKETSCP